MQDLEDIQTIACSNLFLKVLRRLRNQFIAPLNKSISFPQHDFRILSDLASKIPKEKACKSCMKINASPHALGCSEGRQEQRMEKNSVGSFKKSDNK